MVKEIAWNPSGIALVFRAERRKTAKTLPYTQAVQLSSKLVPSGRRQLDETGDTMPVERRARGHSTLTQCVARSTSS